MQTYLIVSLVIGGAATLVDLWLWLLASFGGDSRNGEDALVVGITTLNLLALVPVVVALALALAQ